MTGGPAAAPEIRHRPERPTLAPTETIPLRDGVAEDWLPTAMPGTAVPGAVVPGFASGRGAVGQGKVADFAAAVDGPGRGALPAAAVLGR